MDTQKAMDNPYWPNGSAVERAKDEAAGLHPPQVLEAKWTLNEHDIECLTAGAGILASGGGGDPKHGQKMALKVLHDGKKIIIVNPCRLDANDMGLVCTVALMGDPMAADKSKGSGSVLALKRMEQVIAAEWKYEVTKSDDFPTYKANVADLHEIPVQGVQMPNRITALTAVETGGLNTIEPLVVSAKTDLPCLDVAGQGRSYPELQMFMPFIYGCKYIPASLADSEKDSVICVGADSCEDLENYFRAETVNMGSLSSIAMGAINFETVFLKMVVFASSRAWRLGRAVNRAMKMQSSFLEAILEQQQGVLLLTGKVTHVNTENNGGFTQNTCDIKGLDEYEGYFVQIIAKNENYIAWKVDSEGKKEKILATIPDLISILNLKAKHPLDVPVMAGANCKGFKVAVVILPADPRLYTEHALKVVGPRALGVDADYKEPQLLKKKLV